MGAQGERAAGVVPAPPAAGPRQIVVCCDGTNNTLTGGVSDTNVLQLFELLERHRRAHPLGPEQVLYYDPGVGAPVGLPPADPSGTVSAFASRVSAIALGRGVYANIGQAYLHLCREYARLEPAGAARTTDQIYLFGFSRGAFQVRAVAGMVNLFGLIRPEHEPLLPTLLRVYFAGSGVLGAGERTGLAPLTRAIEGVRVALDAQPSVTVQASAEHGVQSARLTRGDVAEQIRTTFTTPVGADARVHFVGVWDTVESVGLPGFRKRITSSRSIAGKRMTHVRHALALDEHRRQFLPRYYAGPVDEGQTLRQLWFRGVHADIGGRGPFSESGLSSLTLHWMVQEAIACGLRCSPVPVPVGPPMEVMGDQLRARPSWAITGMAVRDPAGADAGTAPDGDGSAFVAEPREHESVAARSPDAGGHPPARGPLHPWDTGNGPRLQAWLIPVLAWIALGFLGLFTAGASITAGPQDGRVGVTLQAGLTLVEHAITHLWRPDLADRQFSAWAAADLPGRQLAPGWALAALLGIAAAAILILARVVVRAFGRLTMWRRLSDRRPRRALGVLGLALPTLVIGVFSQLLALLVAWELGATPLRWVFLVAAAIGWLTALVGAAGCVALIARWLWREGTGR